MEPIQKLGLILKNLWWLDLKGGSLTNFAILDAQSEG